MADFVPSEDHTLAIGRLVVTVSRLESLIIDMIRIFLQARSVVRVVAAFSHQQATSNIDTLKAIYSIGSTDDELKADQTIKTFNMVRAICEFRNTVVHAYWTIGENGETLAVRFQARGKFSRSQQTISSREIHDKADEGERLEQTLRGLRDHLLAANPELFREDPL